MNDYSKIYKELYEIFKYIAKEEIAKIPKNIIDEIEEKKDENYNYKVTHIDDFENQYMHKETKAFLTVLYRDYWANEEERKRIKEQEHIEYINREAELSKNINEIFQNDKKIDKKSNDAIIVFKESFFGKIIKKIISLFN